MNGVEFCCEKIDSTKKAKDSVIMTKNTSSNGPHLCGGVYIGRIQSFISHRSPGSSHSDPLSLIVDAKCFDIPVEHFNVDIGCPNVMRTFRKDHGGNFWSFQAIAATKIILGPHLQHKN